MFGFLKRKPKVVRFTENRDIEGLLQCIEDKNPDVRLLAITALIDFEEKRVTKELIKIIKDDKEDYEIRKKALLGLGHLRANECLDLLCSHAERNNGSSIGLYIAANESIRKIKDPRAKEPLLKSLGWQKDGDVLCELLNSLACFPDDSCVEVIISVLIRPDISWPRNRHQPSIRPIGGACQKILEQIHTPLGVKGMIVLLKRLNVKTGNSNIDRELGSDRYDVLRALSRMGPWAITPVLELIDDSDLVFLEGRSLGGDRYCLYQVLESIISQEAQKGTTNMDNRGRRPSLEEEERIEKAAKLGPVVGGSYFSISLLWSAIHAQKFNNLTCEIVERVRARMKQLMEEEKVKEQKGSA